MVVLAVRGDNLLRALENGVSAAPAFEGRFPQLSGARILYDSTRPPGSRILFASITSEHQSSHHSSSEPPHSSDLLVRPEAVYRVACPFYLAQGRDGYGALRPDAPGNGVVVGIEEAQTLVTMVRTHLRLVAAANGFVHIADKGLQRALQRVKQARVDAADALSSKFGRAASQSVAVTALHHYEHVERQRHAHAHAFSRDDARGPRDHELWDERDEGEEDDDAGDDCEDDGGDEDDGGVGDGGGDGAGDATGDVARLISAVSMTRLVDYTELTDEHLSHASQVSHSHSDEDGDVGLVLDSTAVSHADESQTSNSASVVASTDTAPPTPSPGSSSARAPPAASAVPLVRTASLPVDVPLLARTPSGAIHPKFVRGHADGAPPTSAHPPPRRPARHVRVPRRAEEKVKLAPDVEGRILDCSGRISGAPSVVEHASPLLALRLRQAHDLLKHHT
jgi:5'-nucleotidase, C-terminal domain